MTQDELDDLVGQWHAGDFPDQSLEDVVMEMTGWSIDDLHHWLATGDMPE